MFEVALREARRRPRRERITKASPWKAASVPSVTASDGRSRSADEHAVHEPERRRDGEAGERGEPDVQPAVESCANETTDTARIDVDRDVDLARR